MGKKAVALWALVCVLAGSLAACGGTPQPTEPPPTSAPTIIILTPTPQPESTASSAPTETVAAAVETAISTPKESPTAKSTQAATKAPEATGELSETAAPPTETPGGAQPTATDTPAVGEPKYPAPVLLDPPNNRPVGWKDTVLLIWSSVGELAEDEYYHLHLERPPKPGTDQEWYGDYVFTKETQFLVEGAFLDPFHLPQNQGFGVVYWWVRVVRKTGEDEYGKPIGIDISPHSEKRTLVLDPKP